MEAQFIKTDIQEVRKRNAARRQELQSRQAGMFVKWSNDRDAKLVEIVAPFEGFDRNVKQKDGSVKTRPHYRMHVLGECNFKTGEGAGVSAITGQQIMNLPTYEAKLTTAPQTMSNGISELIDEGHTILCIVRKGPANSKDTTYTVMDAGRLQDKELKALTPNISKTDIALLESQEQWQDITPAERQVFMNLGAAEEDQ